MNLFQTRFQHLSRKKPGRMLFALSTLVFFAMLWSAWTRPGDEKPAPTMSLAPAPAACTNYQAVSRWNKLTPLQRQILDEGGTVTNFNTGLCNTAGTPIFFTEITSSPSLLTFNGILNNKPPRPYGRYSLDNGRESGLGGNKYCFTLSQATPAQVSSTEHKFLTAGEVVRVSAFNGATPVILSGPAGTGNANGITFSGTTYGYGISWFASSGMAAVTQICVEYDYFGGGSASREPFAIELCANRCLYDDFHACSQNQSGAPGCSNLSFLYISKSAVSTNNNGLNTCSNPGGAIGNSIVEFNVSVYAAQAGVNDLFLEDEIANYLGAAFVGIVEPPHYTQVSSNAPQLNPLFDGRVYTDLFIPNTGGIGPDEDLSVSFSVAINPAYVNSPTGLNLIYGGGTGFSGWTTNDLSGSGGGGYGATTSVPMPPTNITAVPAHDVTLEATVMNSMNGLSNFLTTRGGAQFSQPGCTVTWTNDYQPSHWVPGCGTLTGSVDVMFTATSSCGQVYKTCATFSIVDTQGPICLHADTLVLDCGAPNANTILQNWLTTYAGPILDHGLSTPITFTNDFTGLGNVACNGVAQVIHYQATDDCGNSTPFVRYLVLTDNTPPVLNGVPANLTLNNCPANIPVPTVTATDACDPSVTVTFSETSNGNTCNRTIIRNWMATDDCGNSVAASQTITVVDNTPPVFSNVPTDVTVICPATAPPVQTPTVTDCSVYDLVFMEETIGLPCPESAQVIRKWTATDACGNSSMVQQVINIQGQGSTLVFTFIPPGVTAACDQNPTFGTPVATTTCPTGGLSISFEDVVNSNGDCSQPFSITRTWTAHDNCGNLAQATQTINTGPDTQAPVFGSNPANITVDCGADPALPVAFDNCGATLFSYQDSGVSGNCTTGFSFTRTWTATDLCGNASTFMQQVTTGPDMTPPVFTFVPYDQFFDCDEPIVFPDPTAVDNCSDVTITYQDSIIGTGDCHEVNGVWYGYDIVRTWTATDMCGNSTSATTSAWVLPGFNDGNRIAFTYVPPDRALGCTATAVFGEPVCRSVCGEVTLSFTDEITQGNCDGAYSIRRTWMGTDTCGNATIAAQTLHFEDSEAPSFVSNMDPIELPCGAQPIVQLPVVADNCSDVSLIAIQYDDEFLPGSCGGILTRTWSATDPCGNTVLQSQQFIFTDDLSPVFEYVPGNQAVGCSDDLVFGTPVVTDICSNVTLTFEDVTGPVINGAYAVTRTWTATDACGNSQQAAQTLTVTDDTAPVFASTPVNKTVSCGEPIVFDEPAASDPCSAVTVTFSDAVVSSACSTQYTRTWTATDEGGNTAQVSQIVIEVDATPPVFESLPADKTIACGEPLSFDTPTANDACNQTSLTWLDETVASNCTLQHIRTFMAADACGNSTQASQTITVVDEEAPVFDPLPANLAMTQAEFANWTPPVVTADDCSNVAIEMTQTSGTTCSTASHSYTWTATDDCGNTAQHTLTVQLTDVLFAATLSTPPAVDCGESFDLTATVVNGTAPFTYNWEIFLGNGWEVVSGTDQLTAGILTGDGSAVLMFTATDANGCLTASTIEVSCNEEPNAVEDLEIAGVQLLPNPVSHFLTLRYLASPTVGTQFRILNTLGETLSSGTLGAAAGSQEQRFEVAGFAAGAYLLELVQGKKMAVRRFVKL